MIESTVGLMWENGWSWESVLEVLCRYLVLRRYFLRCFRVGFDRGKFLKATLFADRGGAVNDLESFKKLENVLFA